MNEMLLLFEVVNILKATFQSMDGREWNMDIVAEVSQSLKESLSHLPLRDNAVNEGLVMSIFNALREDGTISLHSEGGSVFIKYNFTEEELAERAEALAEAEKKYEADYKKDPEKNPEYLGEWKPVESVNDYAVEAQAEFDPADYVYVDVWKAYPDIDAEFIDTFKFHSLQSAKEFATLNIEPPYRADIYVNEVVSTTVKKKLNY